MSADNGIVVRNIGGKWEVFEYQGEFPFESTYKIFDDKLAAIEYAQELDSPENQYGMSSEYGIRIIDNNNGQTKE